mmetsp:Transcript_22666/g.55167  ORF Transcript_22666/g.55167 Transcript_22666/m.55167 type:complete len:153 (+) Transcript_22666:133-591(+)
MDPEEFALELTRYQVVRSSEWRRDWSRSSRETVVDREHNQNCEPGHDDDTSTLLFDCNENAFFESLFNLLKQLYGREVGGEVATAFKTSYFQDIANISLEEVDDVAKLQLQNHKNTVEDEKEVVGESRAAEFRSGANLHGSLDFMTEEDFLD